MKKKNILFILIFASFLHKGVNALLNKEELKEAVISIDKEYKKIKQGFISHNKISLLNIFETCDIKNLDDQDLDNILKELKRLGYSFNIFDDDILIWKSFWQRTFLADAYLDPELVNCAVKIIEKEYGKGNQGLISIIIKFGDKLFDGRKALPQDIDDIFTELNRREYTFKECGEWGRETYEVFIIKQIRSGGYGGPSCPGGSCSSGGCGTGGCR